MKDIEEKRRFMEAAPKLRKRDVEDINSLFQSYIFTRESTGEVWTSCCRRHEKLKKDHPIFFENHVKQPKAHFGDSHPMIPLNEKTRCPFCGKLGAVKKLQYCGARKNLFEEKRVIVLRWDGRNLWALGAWVHKCYIQTGVQTTEQALCALPTASAGVTYRFSEKSVTWLPASLWGGTKYSHLHTEDYRFFKNTVDRPFKYCAEYGNGYDVIGMDAIEKTPVKYCSFDYGDLIKTLHLAYVYPQKVEMLQKVGLGDCVKRYAEEGVKSAVLLNWDAKTPAEFLKLKGKERREFLQLQKPSPDVVRLRSRFRKLGDEISFKEMEQLGWALHSSVWNDLLKICKDRNLSPVRACRYLKAQTSGMTQAFYAWKDYLDQSEKLGDTLHRSDLIFPKDLQKAHDDTARRYRQNAEKLRKAKEKEKLKIMQEKYQKRRDELEKQFSWHAGGYFIRIPANGDEILQEGKKLQHCVAGYAERHMDGTTTILFLRKEKAPDTPFLTIEMWGKKLHQIHGYKNEGVYSAKGRFAPDPQETFAWFLEPWIQWVEKGSKRNKDGTPKLPKQKKENKTA